MKSINKNYGHKNSIILPVSDHNNVLILLANADQTIEIPSGATTVIFSGSNDFWVEFLKVGENKTPKIPKASITDGTASLINPTSLNVTEYKKISIISAVNCYVSLRFYGD